MIGMLVKECYLLRGVAKTYLLLLGVFCLLGVVGVYDMSVVGGMFSIFVIMMPISGFAFDEQAGWDRYAVSTPAGRAGVVRGKYLFTLGILLCATALNGVLYAVLLHVNPEKLANGEAIAGSMVLSVGLFLMEVLLPMLFKFGSQKGRMALTIVMSAAMGAVFAGMTLVRDGGGWLQRLLPVLSLLLPVIALGGLLISYFTSLAIYTKKEL